MKNYGKLMYTFFAGALLMTIPLQVIIASTESTDKVSMERIVKDKFAGGWNYTVEGAPEGYEEGFLLIVKSGDSYKVQIQTAGTTMMGENVTTKGSSIMFDVMVEDDKVSVSLKVSGSSIAGTSTSSEGTFAVSGTKTLSAE